MDKQLVKDLLLKSFPEECEAVGPGTVNDLVEGRVQYETPGEGRKFPIPEIGFLADALALILVLLEFAFFFMEKKGKRPTETELKEVAEKERAASQLSQEERETIIRNVMVVIVAPAPQQNQGGREDAAKLPDQ